MIGPGNSPDTTITAIAPHPEPDSTNDPFFEINKMFEDIVTEAPEQNRKLVWRRCCELQSGFINRIKFLQTHYKYSTKDLEKGFDTKSLGELNLGNTTDVYIFRDLLSRLGISNEGDNAKTISALIAKYSLYKDARHIIEKNKAGYSANFALSLNIEDPTMTRGLSPNSVFDERYPDSWRKADLSIGLSKEKAVEIAQRTNIQSIPSLATHTFTAFNIPAR